MTISQQAKDVVDILIEHLHDENRERRWQETVQCALDDVMQMFSEASGLDLGRDGIPTFKVKAVGKFWYLPGRDGTRTRGCYLVFKCPKCKKKHSHGGTYGKKGDGDGHRTAHCSCWPSGYYLKEV